MPRIRLTGIWLYRAGFHIGDTIEVIVREHEIRIVRTGLASRGNESQGELF